MRDQIPTADALPAGLPEDKTLRLTAPLAGGHLEVIVNENPFLSQENWRHW